MELDLAQQLKLELPTPLGGIEEAIGSKTSSQVVAPMEERPMSGESIIIDRVDKAEIRLEVGQQ